MALQYTKAELEVIAQRLQCCAADAASEALSGEVFMDYEKKTCGWNKFKFLKKASKILSEYIPGGVYTFREQFSVENTIDPVLGETFEFKGATTIEDILSPYYGFSFVVFGEPTTGETYMYIIYDGELHSVVDSSMYIGPYMLYIQSVAFDNSVETLLLGATDNIQEFDLAPLLLTPPGIPTAVSTTAYPGSDNLYAAFNRMNDSVYFTNTYPTEVKRFYTYSNFSISIPVGSIPSHIAVNSSNGEVWVVCGTDINVIDPSSNIVTFVIDLFSSLGASSVNKISYSDQLGLFMVPYFDGIFTYKVALLNIDGSVNVADIFQDSNTIFHSIYYQQLEKYIIGTDYTTYILPENIGIFTELVRTLLNDTKNNKVIVCTTNIADGLFGPIYSSTPFRISILSAPEEEMTLCLTDDDVQTIIETSQHYCCDCCEPSTITINANDFSNNPEQSASSEVAPSQLYTIYYGKSTEDGLAKLDPLEILTLTSVNRYQFPGVYNYYVSVASYLYFAVPTTMGIPTGFYDAATNTAVVMQAPYFATYAGITYRVYRSKYNTYSSNISLKVT